MVTVDFWVSLSVVAALLDPGCRVYSRLFIASVGCGSLFCFQRPGVRFLCIINQILAFTTETQQIGDGELVRYARYMII